MKLFLQLNEQVITEKNSRIQVLSYQDLLKVRGGTENDGDGAGIVKG